MRHRLLTGFGLAVITMLLFASSAFGGTYLNTIEPVATMHGRHLRVTVIIGCDAGQHLTLRVTSTQRQVGAVAQGWERTTCSGKEQHIPVDITAPGRERFVPVDTSDSRTVETCVLAMTSSRGRTDDSHQWCKDLTLQVDSSLTVRDSSS